MTSRSLAGDRIHPPTHPPTLRASAASSPARQLRRKQWAVTVSTNVGWRKATRSCQLHVALQRTPVPIAHWASDLPRARPQVAALPATRIHRRSILDGLINEYSQAA
jgi:hypothetical protein